MAQQPFSNLIQCMHYMRDFDTPQILDEMFSSEPSSASKPVSKCQEVEFVRYNGASKYVEKTSKREMKCEAKCCMRGRSTSKRGWWTPSCNWIRVSLSLSISLCPFPVNVFPLSPSFSCISIFVLASLEKVSSYKCIQTWLTIEQDPIVSGQ